MFGYLFLINSNKCLHNSSIVRGHIRTLLSHFRYMLDEQMEVDIHHVMGYLNVKKIQISLR
jgi:hypothetical protein